MAGTGDGFAIPYRRGVPLMDMEFYQFHPTGLYKLGILLSEAARGEGGILRNGEGEAFAARYAPTLKDLAPRDMVSRFIYQEVKEGRGIDGKDYVYSISPIFPETSSTRSCRTSPILPGPISASSRKRKACRFSRPRTTRWAACRPISMARCLQNEQGTSIPGLYSAGESACVSVHGANRLGTNSLVDLVVFGRRAGRHMLEFVKTAELAAAAGRSGARRPAPRSPACLARPRASRLPTSASACKSMMMDKVSVVRNRRGPDRGQQACSVNSRCLQPRRDRGQGRDLQHRSDGGAGAGLHARLRRDDRRRRACSRGEPGRALSLRLRERATTRTGLPTRWCARRPAACD